VTLRFDFASHPCELAGMRQSARDFLEKTGFEELQAELIVLALDEACTNIIRHAYQGDPNGRIELEMHHEPTKLSCTLRDFGKPCDPSRLQSRDLDDFRPGGLGLHIMQKAFDEVTFCPKGSGTDLLLTKHLPSLQLDN
jgi:anti-sigma regulatory factor (Ser/Thr protein kinase)